MGRRAPDTATLARALKAPGFVARDVPVESCEPVSPATLVLSVADIKCYEHNPRHSENAEYPRLKESIRARGGLTTPLTVTKRPGDTLYTIAAGGNSRLRALKELADETKDERFASVTCRFEPWQSECHVFANHLIENDVRGKMSFGDKAAALADWQRLYEESHPEEAPLSQRSLAERLAQTGYPVPRTLIVVGLRTADFLLPHLPVAFGSGLGRPAAEQLLRLRACALQYWQARRASTDAAAFEPLFADACGAHDCHSTDWDHERFRAGLVARLAHALSLDHKIVALDLDGLYHGCAVEPGAAPAGPIGEPAVDAQLPWAFERARAHESERRGRSRAKLEARAARSTLEPDRAAVAERPPDGASESTQRAPATLDQLRAETHAAAETLTARHGLQPYLQRVSVGLGFFVEPPAPPAVPSAASARPAPAQGLVLNGLPSALWWALCLLAEQTSPRHRAALATVRPASWWVELIEQLPTKAAGTDPFEALEMLVGRPTPAAWVADLFMHPEFTDEDLDLLQKLVKGCRQLRGRAAAERLDLWETP